MDMQYKFIGIIFKSRDVLTLIILYRYIKNMRLFK